MITKGENQLLDNYDQIFRDLGNQQYNDETMFEYGWYSTNGPDVRTGYTMVFLQVVRTMKVWVKVVAR